MYILEMINNYVRKFDRYLVSSVDNIAKSRYWQSFLNFIKANPTYVILSVTILYFVFRDSDSVEGEKPSLEKRIWESEIRPELWDLSDQVEMLSKSLDNLSSKQENRDEKLLQSLKEKFDEIKQSVDLNDKNVEPENASNRDADDANKSKNLDVSKLDLGDASDFYQRNDEEVFKEHFSGSDSALYVIHGKLELNRFSGYSMYGIKQGGDAILLASANALDYWFPKLRDNVGNEVILGTSSLKYAIIFNGVDQIRLAAGGYSAKGKNVMCTGDIVIKGIPPITKANGEQDMEEHAKNLNALYSAFLKSIESLD